MTKLNEDGLYFGRAVKWTATSVAALSAVITGVVGLLGLQVGKGWFASTVPRISLFITVAVATVILVAAVVFVWVDQARLRNQLGRALNSKAALEEALQLLEDVKYFDPITGIPNSTALERDLRGGGRMSSGRLRCLIKLDLENFRKVNKQAGHWAGDEYLRSFATVVYRASRRDEATYRRSQSADEFYVLLRGNILDGLGFLNRLDGKAAEFDTVARSLGSDYSFAFRAAIIVLADGEDLSHAEKRLDPPFVRVSESTRRYRVDWGKRADDVTTPDTFDDTSEQLQGGDAVVFAAARTRFRVY